jgi:hypothetical protein
VAARRENQQSGLKKDCNGPRRDFKSLCGKTSSLRQNQHEICMDLVVHRATRAAILWTSAWRTPGAYQNHASGHTMELGVTVTPVAILWRPPCNAYALLLPRRPATTPWPRHHASPATSPHASPATTPWPRHATPKKGAFSREKSLGPRRFYYAQTQPCIARVYSKSFFAPSAFIFFSVRAERAKLSL